MIKPIPVGEVMDYTLPKDKDNPTIWKLATLDSVVKSRLMAKMVSVQPDPSNPSVISVTPKSGEDSLRLDFEILRFGLKGFSNFKLNGKDVPFETEELTLGGKTYKVVSDKTLGYIPREVIGQLSNKVFGSSEVSEQEEKNS